MNSNNKKKEVIIEPSAKAKQARGMWRGRSDPCYGPDDPRANPLNNYMTGDPDQNMQQSIKLFQDTRSLKYLPLTVHMYDNIEASQDPYHDSSEGAYDKIVYVLRIPTDLEQFIEQNKSKVLFNRWNRFTKKKQADNYTRYGIKLSPATKSMMRKARSGERGVYNHATIDYRDGVVIGDTTKVLFGATVTLKGLGARGITIGDHYKPLPKALYDNPAANITSKFDINVDNLISIVKLQGLDPHSLRGKEFKGSVTFVLASMDDEVALPMGNISTVKDKSTENTNQVCEAVINKKLFNNDAVYDSDKVDINSILGDSLTPDEAQGIGDGVGKDSFSISLHFSPGDIASPQHVGSSLVWDKCTVCNCKTHPSEGILGCEWVYVDGWGYDTGRRFGDADTLVAKNKFGFKFKVFGCYLNGQLAVREPVVMKPHPQLEGAETPQTFRDGQPILNTHTLDDYSVSHKLSEFWAVWISAFTWMAPLDQLFIAANKEINKNINNWSVYGIEEQIRWVAERDEKIKPLFSSSVSLIDKVEILQTDEEAFAAYCMAVSVMTYFIAAVSFHRMMSGVDIKSVSYSDVKETLPMRVMEGATQQLRNAFTDGAVALNVAQTLTNAVAGYIETDGYKLFPDSGIISEPGEMGVTILSDQGKLAHVMNIVGKTLYWVLSPVWFVAGCIGKMLEYILTGSWGSYRHLYKRAVRPSPSNFYIPPIDLQEGVGPLCMELGEDNAMASQYTVVWDQTTDSGTNLAMTRLLIEQLLVSNPSLRSKAEAINLIRSGHVDNYDAWTVNEICNFAMTSETDPDYVTFYGDDAIVPEAVTGDNYKWFIDDKRNIMSAYEPAKFEYLNNMITTQSYTYIGKYLVLVTGMNPIYEEAANPQNLAAHQGRVRGFTAKLVIGIGADKKKVDYCGTYVSTREFDRMIQETFDYADNFIETVRSNIDSAVDALRDKYLHNVDYYVNNHFIPTIHDKVFGNVVEYGGNTNVELLTEDVGGSDQKDDNGGSKGNQRWVQAAMAGIKVVAGIAMMTAGICLAFSQASQINRAKMKAVANANMNNLAKLMRIKESYDYVFTLIDKGLMEIGNRSDLVRKNPTNTFTYIGDQNNVVEDMKLVGHASLAVAGLGIGIWGAVESASNAKLAKRSPDGKLLPKYQKKRLVKEEIKASKKLQKNDKKMAVYKEKQKENDNYVETAKRSMDASKELWDNAKYNPNLSWSEKMSFKRNYKQKVNDYKDATETQKKYDNIISQKRKTSDEVTKQIDDIKSQRAELDKADNSGIDVMSESSMATHNNIADINSGNDINFDSPKYGRATFNAISGMEDSLDNIFSELTNSKAVGLTIEDRLKQLDESIMYSSRKGSSGMSNPTRR